MPENVALVLLNGETVVSVVLVRKEALDKRPDILERLRREASELYCQSIVVEENLRQVDSDGLIKWLDEMNGSELDFNQLVKESAALGYELLWSPINCGFLLTQAPPGYGRKLVGVKNSLEEVEEFLEHQRRRRNGSGPDERS